MKIMYIALKCSKSDYLRKKGVNTPNRPVVEHTSSQLLEPKCRKDGEIGQGILMQKHEQFHPFQRAEMTKKKVSESQL